MSRLGMQAMQRIAALVVLLGIVAMHQLTGGSHTMAGHATAGAPAAGTPAAVALPLTGGATPMAAGSAAASLSPEVQTSHRDAATAVAPPAVAAPTPDLMSEGMRLGHGGLAVCLAVLVALLALAPPGQWTQRVGTHLSLAAARVRRLRATRGPAHPLVSLCVLRT